MEIEGQYLTYEEYRGLGGNLDQMPFNLLEFNARRKIDEKTMNRLVGIGNKYSQVKMCIFNLIPIIESYGNTQNKAVSSESIDGYSISYATPQTSFTEAKNGEINDIINSTLFGLTVNGEHVLYSGV